VNTSSTSTTLHNNLVGLVADICGTVESCRYEDGAVDWEEYDILHADLDHETADLLEVYLQDMGVL